eukprot:1073896-Rhodomonas_salina.3
MTHAQSPPRITHTHTQRTTHHTHTHTHTARRPRGGATSPGAVDTKARAGGAAEGKGLPRGARETRLLALTCPSSAPSPKCAPEICAFAPRPGAVEAKALAAMLLGFGAGAADADAPGAIVFVGSGAMDKGWNPPR